MSKNQITPSSPIRLFASAVGDLRRQRILNACSDAFTKHEKIVPRRRAPSPPAPSPLMPKREIILMAPTDFALEDRFDELIITDELPCEEPNSTNQSGMTAKMQNIGHRSPQQFMEIDSSVIGFYNQGSFREDFRGLVSLRYFTFKSDEGKKLIGSWVTKESAMKKIYRPS